MPDLVSIGGGLSSTMELPIHLIERRGRDGYDFVMCKLPNEDPDVWRLVEAMQDYLHIQVRMIGLNLTLWDIFYRERMLGNSRIDPCSKNLKRLELLKEVKATRPNNILVGVTYDEIDRMAAIRANWTANGYNVAAPLADDPTITRTWLMDKCKALLGFVPRLYLMGMSHNNCGGACIKAGKAQWARLLWFLPDVYDWWETNENKFRREIGKYTILTEGFPKRPLTLTAFRLRMEQRWHGLLPGFDPFDGLEETPPCVHCEAA